MDWAIAGVIGLAMFLIGEAKGWRTGFAAGQERERMIRRLTTFREAIAKAVPVPFSDEEITQVLADFEAEKVSRRIDELTGTRRV